MNVLVESATGRSRGTQDRLKCQSVVESWILCPCYQTVVYDTDILGAICYSDSLWFKEWTEMKVEPLFLCSVKLPTL